MIYGKIIDGKLVTSKAISLGCGQFITNPTDKQYIEHRYKEVIDIQPSFANYETSYTETETQIIVKYVEVVVPMMVWHKETNFQIKLTPLQNANMLKKHPSMAMYASVLPCFIEFDFVYLYANYIKDEDKLKLQEFNAIITNKY